MQKENPNVMMTSIPFRQKPGRRRASFRRCGARVGLDPIWLESPASVRRTGNWLTCTTRVTLCRTRSWLFRGDANRPSQDALDVVAYLNTLGRPALQAAAPHGGTASLMDARFIASMPQATNDLEEGRAVYMANCSGCHGVDGRAHSPRGRALRSVAFDLAD